MRMPNFFEILFAGLKNFGFGLVQNQVLSEADFEIFNNCFKQQGIDLISNERNECYQLNGRWNSYCIILNILIEILFAFVTSVLVIGVTVASFL